MTTIVFDVVYHDGEECRKDEVPCFGRLREFKEQVAWGGFPKPDEHGGIKGIRYMPDSRAKRAASIAYFDYLMSTNIFGDLVLNKADGAAKMLEDGVLVSADATPHHMLNTLSIYRHVYIFPEGVNIFHALLSRGVNKHMAFFCSGLCWGGDKISARSEEDSEHTVLCYKTIVDQDYTDYVNLYVDGPDVPVDQCNKEHYAECMTYGQGVATWLSKSDTRKSDKDVKLLRNKLMPMSYDVRYDKVLKKVLSVSPVSGEVSLDGNAELVEKLNALHIKLTK
jgi:hypothetical protein